MAKHYTKQDIEAKVEELVVDILVGTDLELVDVEYVKEIEWYLRVFLDKPGGIDVDDCQAVSEKLEAKLDELDPIKESYYLEVSSPGIGRQLKKERDFIRHLGEVVEVHTYAPIKDKKLLIGTLLGYNDGNLTIAADGQEMVILQQQIAQVRLHIDF